MPIVSSLQMGKAEVAKLDFTQEEVDGLKAKLLELTKATIIVRSPKRDANGQCIYIEVPNVGIQLAATVKALEFGVGKARQMIEVTGNAGTGQGQSGVRDLAKLMGENPDIAIKVLKALQCGLNPAQTIDVTPVDPGFVPPLPESHSGGSPSAKR